jgi:histidine triad (HIT) family protein
VSDAPQCPFCAIVRGDEPARVVWSDPHAIAFLPLRPAATGHTLVAPREHFDDIWALGAAGGLPTIRLTRAVLHVANGVRQALRPEGLNIINSAGAAASQTVLHLHVHLVPRWTGDRIGNIWPPDRPAAAAAQDKVAALIRAECAAVSP